MAGGQRNTGGGNVLANPGLLAAGAGGLAAAVLALWAFRGLPLGVLALWVTPLPLFLAGLGFGASSAALAAGLAAALIAALAGAVPVLVFLALFGVPAPLLAAAALRSGRGAAANGGAPDLAGPLVVLGLWPLAVLLSAAAALSGGDGGGLEGALRRAVEGSLARMGVAAGDALVGTLVRVKAAAIGFVAALSLVANAFAARGVLLRRGLALAPAPPDLAALALPAWYPALPALAAAAFLAAPAGGDAVPLSALLLSLVPLFLLGVAGVHLRARGRRGATAALAAFYALLVLFPQVLAPAAVALGLTDHVIRRRRGGGGGGAAPTPTT